MKTKLSVIGIATLLILAAPSCKKGNSAQQQQPQDPELSVLSVSENMANLETGYPTTLKGVNDVEIRPQVSGFLTKVCVQEGQRVSKGTPLFQIDRVQLQAAVEQAQAAVAVAQANVNTAATNANNNKILLDQNIIGAPAYQTSANQLNAARASLSQAQAALIAARKNLSYATVTAPTSGVVGVIDYKEGALVSPSTLLTILSNNGEMEARFSINEKEVLALTDNGQRSLQSALSALPEVTLLLANGERYPYKGKIVSMSGVLDPATGSANVRAIFPNPNGMLRSGNTGQILMPNNYNDVIQIPQSATYEVQDMKFVYVVNDSNILKSRPIQVAPENDGKTFIVTGGLKPGEKIVIEGVGVSAKEGMKIKPKM